MIKIDGKKNGKRYNNENDTNEREMGKNLNNNNHKLYDPKNETPICHNNTLITLFEKSAILTIEFRV